MITYRKQRNLCVDLFKVKEKRFFELRSVIDNAVFWKITFSLINTR